MESVVVLGGVTFYGFKVQGLQVVWLGLVLVEPYYSGNIEGQIKGILHFPVLGITSWCKKC